MAVMDMDAAQADMTVLGKPHAAFGSSLLPKAMIEAGHPWMPIPMTTIFPDERVAEAYLSYGVNTMHLEMQLVLDALRRNAHTVRVFALQDQVFILLKYKVKPQLGFAGEYFKAEVGTEVNVKIMSSMFQRPRTSNCYVISNRFDLKGVDMVLLVHDKPRDYFGRVATE